MVAWDSKMPEVSVIIPSYGRPIYLKRAIASVMQQSFLDWELIVVDDNPWDSEARRETQRLMQEYMQDSKVQYIKHFENRNGAAARNTGIAAAAGKYITFLDDDDEYLPERLEKCVDVLNRPENDSYRAVYTGCRFQRNGKKYFEYKNVKSGSFLADTLKGTFMLCSGSNIFMRAEAVRELKGFDETFIRHQDYEFMVRFFRKDRILAIPEVLLVKNQLNSNIPHTEKMHEIKKHYWKTFQDDIQKQDKDVQKEIYLNGYLQLMEYAAREHNKTAIHKYKCLAAKYGKIPLKNRMRILVFEKMKGNYHDRKH